MAEHTTEAAEAATHAAEGEHGVEAAAHGGGEAVGMPQLDFSSWPNQIFWLVIALVAIYLILSRIALPRIAAVLAERAGTVTNDIAAAEELKLKAQEAEEAYNKALADARAEANKIIGEAKAEIQAELDDANAKADAEIAAKTAESEKAIAEIRENALQSVEEVAKSTAAEIVAALGHDADKAAIDKAVDANLKGA
ncbi:F0F1 ATP synthase subunit B' [Psychromarinibacter sp. C21-152]|uniref:ATP synthase subunit b n=1 Tax=Psychromarinibacter sediminicola TaxID=3033385 RepID=A0AAE3T930_9RHOB|nr:F0F1 ATP synthase subunit B' [Psychromarinibacter sediminicola]MDF0601777.1 F0F1 ATP synthase subunit B' [Psychromarinibacter sediminicola]